MEKLPPVNGKSSAWDRIVLNGEQIGGIGLEPHIKVKVAGFVGRKFDEQKADGEDEATLADKGIDLSKPRIEIIAMADETSEGQAYRDLVWSVLKKYDPTRGGFTATAIPVVYPSLNACGINEIVIQRVQLPEPIGGGSLRFVVECLKYAPAPKPKTKQQGGGTIPASTSDETLETARATEEQANNLVRQAQEYYDQAQGDGEQTQTPGQRWRDLWGDQPSDPANTDEAGASWFD